MFDVRIVRDERGRISSITFSGSEFEAESSRGRVRIWLDDEAGMSWERIKAAVDAEEAWESGDHVAEPAEAVAA